MSDDFDLRLRRELRALADAVPTGFDFRPASTASARRPISGDPERPVLTRVRAGRGPSVAWSAAAVCLVLAVVVAAALFGGGLNRKPGASGALGPTQTPVPVTTVQPRVVASFGADDLTATVLGPDGAGYVIDNSVTWRVDLQTGATHAVTELGLEPVAGYGSMGKPRLLATGGGDVLILDDQNQVWRWRPAGTDANGGGDLEPVYIPDNKSWSSGVVAIGTSNVNPAEIQFNGSALDPALYDLYIADPGAHQILIYRPTPDGSGYATESRSFYFALPLDLSHVDGLLIDSPPPASAPVYLLVGGAIWRFELGQAAGGWWSSASQGGPAPYYMRLTSDTSAPDAGALYAYDHANHRVVAFAKKGGAAVGEYAAPAGTSWFTSVGDMFVVPANSASGPTLYWIENSKLMSADLPPTGLAMPAATPTLPARTPNPNATPRPTIPTPVTPEPSRLAVSSRPGRFTPAGPVTTGCCGPTTLLGDGRVLILDGSDAGAETFDPTTNTFSPTESMVAARAYDDTATLLRDGRVLIAGGWSNDHPLASAELYDPSSGKFSPTGSMSTARSGHQATLLQDGRVLVTGGNDGRNTFSTAEIYDPSTGTFSPTGSMLTTSQTATLLDDGRVLVTAGPNMSSAVRVAELYDPQAGTFSTTGSMAEAAAGQTATLLADGRVLIVGGGDEGDPTTAIAELYDPQTGGFSGTGSMSVPREYHTVTRLRDGRVLVAGGQGGSGPVYDSAEVWDPATGQFSGAAAMSTRRSRQTATLLADGRVLIAGGDMGDTAELFQP